MKIYTKTGDEGKTSLIGGTRVDKDDRRVACYGTVDELNAHIGLLRDYLNTIALENILPIVQNNLFVIGSLLATDMSKPSKILLPELQKSDVVFLESEIDRMQATLSQMTHFILPGGNIIVSHAHISRTICRRAERLCVGLSGDSANEKIFFIIQYLNRLSDYLFVLARYIGKELNVEEIKWIPEK